MTQTAQQEVSSDHETVEAGQMFFATGGCTLGTFLVATGAGGVRAVLIGDDEESLERDLRRRFAGATCTRAAEALSGLTVKVANVLENPTLVLDEPLDLGGTAFERRVWIALAEIPAGETASYGEVARRLGAPGAARAVAKACAANALAVVIPCHRVVRSDGGISGYRWGVERKRLLLARERAA